MERCDGINSLTGYIWEVDEHPERDEAAKLHMDMHMMRLSFISDTAAPGDKGNSSTEPNVMVSVRFKKRVETCGIAELEKWLKLFGPLSIMLGRALPEVCFANAEPQSRAGILQIFSNAFDAKGIKSALDVWRLHTGVPNGGPKFEYVADETGLTVRQLQNRNGTRSISKTSGICFCESNGSYSTELIEILQQEAKKAMGTSSPITSFYFATLDEATAIGFLRSEGKSTVSKWVFAKPSCTIS